MKTSDLLIQQVFGTLTSASQPIKNPCVEIKRAEKETAMYDFDDTSMDAAKDRFLSRAERICLYTTDALAKKYGLTNDAPPQTAEELVQRIKDGKYIIPTNTNNIWSGNLWGIQWRDPSITKDQAGYDAAKKTLYSLVTTAKDEIYAFEATEGLKSLRTLETAAGALIN